jgi:hypothetical protein
MLLSTALNKSLDVLFYFGGFIRQNPLFTAVSANKAS